MPTFPRISICSLSSVASILFVLCSMLSIFVSAKVLNSVISDSCFCIFCIFSEKTCSATSIIVSVPVEAPGAYSS